MSRYRCDWVTVSAWIVLGGLAATLAGVEWPVVAAAQGAPDVAAERLLAAGVSETRMAESVRRLVAFGPRQYGTPSNHEAAAWIADDLRAAGLEVTIRKDTARDWYQPTSWDVRAAGKDATSATVLETAWPSTGAPPAKGQGPLSLKAATGAVCLTSTSPAPEAMAGCVAVLFDGRASPSGWPTVGRLRGGWTIPVFGVSPRETAPLRERLAAGEPVQVSFALEARTGKDSADTVVATLPGMDRTKYVLFCAHGDSDSGGPGADDNASGVAVVMEIARAAAAAVKSGAMPRPAWDMRFASWGGEMASTREYVASLDKDPSRLQAVINFDQAGFGSSKDALYVEPDDVALNKTVIGVVRAVMKDHLGTPGFPAHAASVKSQGGTDSYVFQDTRDPRTTPLPAVTIYTSAWARPQEQPVTPGFPPLNWYADERPGTVTVDGDAFYHSAGDTPAHTTDTEPFDMGWSARVALLSALRLMNAR